MCSQSTANLSKLPVETLHHIFDELDAQTIVLGLARTCQRLRAVVKSYDRYRLDFQWLSKSDFKLMCHLVDPRDVISLTLSQYRCGLDHVELFLSLVKTRQLSRLRTLILGPLVEQHLTLVVKSIPFQSVTSLSVAILPTDDRPLSPTTKFLSSAIAQVKPRRLKVSFGLERLQKIVWSNQTQLEYLTIGVSIHWDLLCEVLAQLPRLRTLVLDDVNWLSSKSHATVFPQITSFTFTNATLLLERLELMLSLMPSLNHFKLVGDGDYVDGERWEHFIQTQLPLLMKFNIFINHFYIARRTPAYVESIMASYRTPFWLEQKKWFVTCEYCTDELPRINLFSMPICVSSLKYKSKATTVSLTTVDVSHENAFALMDNVTTVQIDVNSPSLKNLQMQVRVSE